MAAIFGTKASKEASTKSLAIDKSISKLDVVERIETESCNSQVAVAQPTLHKKKKNKKRDLSIVELESELSTTTVEVDNCKPRENIANGDGDDSVSTSSMARGVRVILLLTLRYCSNSVTRNG